jgi:hypothetical protein
MKKILDWFSPKSKCCNAPMKNVQLHTTGLRTQINVYECQSCKKEYKTNKQ